MLEVRAHNGRKEPSTNDLVCLRPEVHGKNLVENSPLLAPTSRDLRRKRTGRPGVHHVGITHKAARFSAILLRIARRRFARRIDRHRVFTGYDRRAVLGLPVLVEGIPNRKRNPEETLTADAPVGIQAFYPGRVAGLHVRRVPGDLVAPLEKLGARVQRLDEPLTAGDDLERPVALLVELDRMSDRLGLGQQIAGFGELLDNALLGLLGVEALEFVVVALRPIRVLRFPTGLSPDDRHECASPADGRANRQLEFPPPEDVRSIAESTDHGDSAALAGVSEFVRQDRDPNAEERGRHLLTEQRPIALVLGMGNQRHARSDQFRPRGFDRDHLVFVVKGHPVICGRGLAIFDLGLRHRGLKIHIPQSRSLDLIGQPLGEHAGKGTLRDALCDLADRGVGQRPVDRETQATP